MLIFRTLRKAIEATSQQGVVGVIGAGSGAKSCKLNAVGFQCIYKHLRGAVERSLMSKLAVNTLKIQ